MESSSSEGKESGRAADLKASTHEKASAPKVRSHGRAAALIKKQGEAAGIKAVVDRASSSSTINLDSTGSIQRETLRTVHVNTYTRCTVVTR